VARKYSVEAVLADTERIERVWTDNPTFTLGEVTLQNLKDKRAALRQKRDQLESLRMQVVALTNDLNSGAAELETIRTRALSGLRAVYGPNSTQYEQGGGTRTSERRRPSRKKNGDGTNT
jgi:DNA repair ATPase RecN